MSLLGECIGTDLGQLGDVFCTGGEAQAAQAAVQAMRAVFEQLGQPSRFRSAVMQIDTEWNQVGSVVGGLFPILSGEACSKKAIGQKAEALTREMQKAAGVQPAAPSAALKAGLDLGAGAAQLGTVVKWVAIAGGGVLVYNLAMKGRRR